MAPASFLARGSSSALTSSMEAKPPEAMTGMEMRLGQRNRRVEIEALEQPVARDVGKNDRGDAGILEPLRDFERGHLRGLGPAFDRDLAVAGVETDRDAAGKFFRGALHQFRIAHRRGADDHARDALVEPGLRPS